MWRVDCARGSVVASNVVVATNGYTGALTPWLRRRVIPIGSYIIATEPIPRVMMDRLMPRDRIVSDTRKVVYYYRASPDRQRILFGGRVSHNETDPKISGPRLHAEMVRIFPELARTRISHSWAGFVAYTFDEMMHVGVRDGLYYAMGYCGSGVGMAGYLGTRIGQQVLGLKQGATAFDGLPFATRPFYWGTPWFLAPSVAYYRWRDRSGRSDRLPPNRHWTLLTRRQCQLLRLRRRRSQRWLHRRRIGGRCTWRRLGRGRVQRLLLHRCGRGRHQPRLQVTANLVFELHVHGVHRRLGNFVERDTQIIDIAGMLAGCVGLDEARADPWRRVNLQHHRHNAGNNIVLPGQRGIGNTEYRLPGGSQCLQAVLRHGAQRLDRMDRVQCRHVGATPDG